mmetsp:Transcript_21456/g.59677  ORF Transcript_21456/g.59677 Transcript_21456/m.59677 type:complete len:244 (+) Transcript_21456:176-907(+)
MGRQLRGKIGVNLRHHEQPYLFLNSMSGTADLRSDAPAILAGNQLRGWVDITFSGKHSEVFDSDASVQAVVTVEGLERRLNGASGNAIRTAGVSSHPKTADKLEDETTRQQIGRGIVLLWKRHKTYDISHGDDPQIHFEVDIPEDTPDSFEALTLKRYYLSDTKGLHGDVVVSESMNDCRLLVFGLRVVSLVVANINCVAPELRLTLLHPHVRHTTRNSTSSKSPCTSTRNWHSAHRMPSASW